MKWLGLALLLLFLVMPVFAGDGLHESFEDLQPPGWEFNGGIIEHGTLRLEAICSRASAPVSEYASRAGNWSDFVITVRARVVNNQPLGFKYRVSDAGAYFVSVDSYVAIYRETDDGGHRLSSAALEFTDDWRDITIRVVDNLHEVTVNGQFVILAVDPDPLPPGGIMLGHDHRLVSGEFDAVTIAVGEDIPPLSPNAGEILPLVVAAADPSPALDEIVLAETVALAYPDRLPWLDEVRVDTSQQGVIRYQQWLGGTGAANNYLVISRYSNATQAARALVEYRSDDPLFIPDCGQFHGLPACWNHETFVDGGDHYIDQRWLAWVYQDRLFGVGLGDASTVRGGVSADDPLPLAETLYTVAVEYGLIDVTSP